MAQGEHCSVSSNRDQEHQRQDAEIRETLSHIKNKILVMSGKGGVGKSSVAAYLAILLARKGLKVGLMDIDLHGPSIPRLLGLKEDIRAVSEKGKAEPIHFLPNLQVISIESLMGENKDMATIWRGPLKIGVIRQFISDIDWPDLDFLIIDSPPGTGDEPLTVAQTIPDAKAVIVTTPQEISLADVRKSINFCRHVNMSILGIVENMSGLVCPHCGKSIDLFSARGGQLTAKKENIPLLASLPIEPEFVRKGDSGRLADFTDENLAFVQEFNKMVEKITQASKTKAKEVSTAMEKQEDKSVQPKDRILFAVPVAGGKLSAHFGHCEQFALVETEGGKIKGKTMHTPPAHEPGVLPKWLHEKGAHIIIAGGMGTRAQQIFNENGIRVITGAPAGSPEELVSQYLSETLETGDNLCDH
ncbi:MAG: P-loop NTPase [Deltaproteobacteria bacterium]|nr:P-loop NTPase [Deltaproteobacteria bacterium]MBW1921729.1 P-loop NTPase [Deltaproteobacteria bacterium]MBW1935498.1 P-loop NTPase [Deltaproteobacteria bacterium]MBW1978700.1 P-loop NTPase [Deltaproteobacteria bacterium]MBW2044197.1 P-loop NTPase [Deltaproteobacteria bacterium]